MWTFKTPSTQPHLRHSEWNGALPKGELPSMDTRPEM